MVIHIFLNIDVIGVRTNLRAKACCAAVAAPYLLA